MASVDTSILAHLDPISSLTPGRQAELAGLCFVETVSRDLDPFRMNLSGSTQSLYLLRGELDLQLADGGRKRLRGGSEEARQPIAGAMQAIALTDLDIVRIDMDLLDIMMTWDQFAGYNRSSTAEASATPPDHTGRGVSEWMCAPGAFAADKLQSGLFCRLPPANVEEMFRRMNRMPVKAGQTIIVQGAEGDYYYLIESGTAEVTRAVAANQPQNVLAELQPGDAFGEEALVSDGKRNATVIMKTDGVLLRLMKADFAELLQAPLVSTISATEAEAMAAAGRRPLWLDVRFPSEYRAGHRPGAINAPLHEIRVCMRTLDPQQEYITCCQSGRRSSVAAFIMAQQGFRVRVLEGGVAA
ncbi:cyclic nucleotide-gated potassium channel [mine drainage metagenome]|uniref:Cyclic nucleotide-gated potassium channel n=1 Tax=mine drainage metagenome TaxID=410659 RepID=A0A1J5QFR5_9ZZZZ